METFNLAFTFKTIFYKMILNNVKSLCNSCKCSPSYMCMVTILFYNFMI